VVADVVARYFEDEDRFAAAIDRGAAALDRGESLSHVEVGERLARYLRVQ
jgi:predicted transcriptional regulator